MGQKGLVLWDTNILIEHYKNNQQIIEELRKIGQENIVISIITVGELIYGALNKIELRRILQDISHLQVFHINSDIGNLHLDLMTDFSLSHNLTLPDAFIAATAIYHKIPLYTLNKKDFRFLERLDLYL